jgi:autotransporter-associated beta strand protein
VKTGAGTLDLTRASNTYTGGTVVRAGTLRVAADGSLGDAAAPVAVEAGARLTYTGTTGTARTFSMPAGTLEAAAGATVTLDGASVNGGFLRGTGTFAVTGGAALTAVTTFATTALNQTGAAGYTNFANGGGLTVAGGTTNPATVNGFTNEGSGSITVAGGSRVNAADFQTYGVMSLAPGTTAVPSQVTNTGGSPLFLNGGSRTFVGTPATAGTFSAGIDLNGKNVVVAGGLLVNNGYVVDSAAGSPGRVIADFGSLVKGAGFYQSTVVTQNGGQFQAGNSPGTVSFGEFTFGPGGVDRYVFSINDADGAAGQPGGWGLVKAVRQSIAGGTTPGDFAWTATPAGKVTVALETLVGGDVAGPMADFDPTRAYAWPAVTWDGAYTGPTDPAALLAATAFDTAGFANPVGGVFGWSLDTAGQTLSLTYTPVPEPGALALLGVAAAAAGYRRWRRRPTLAQVSIPD